jgi:hypothetical protein
MATTAVTALVAVTGNSSADMTSVRASTAPTGHVVSTSPFTWTGSQGNISVTETFEPGAKGVMHTTATFTNRVTGESRTVTALSAVNPDGSVSTVAGLLSNPKQRTYTYPAGSVAAASVCTKCVAAAGGAAAAAAIVCIFTAGWGCVAAWGAATAGSAAYCGNNPCGGDNASCSDSSWAGRYSDPYSPGYNLEVNGTVECSDQMQQITITNKVYKDGSLYYTDTYPPCYNDYSCGWSTFFGAPTGHCYKNVMSWTGSYHNPATNQIINYGDSNVTSGTVCI